MRVLFLALALLLSVPPVGEAQETRRPIRIGVLNAAFAASHPTVEGLKAGLRELGFEDGRQVTFDIRFTEGRLDTMPEAAGALVKSGVDVIFTSQEAATKAARTARRSPPSATASPSGRRSSTAPTRSRTAAPARGTTRCASRCPRGRSTPSSR